MDRYLTYAIIKPILKKISHDPDVLTNYRPISRLPIFSNIMYCKPPTIYIILKLIICLSPSRVLTGSHILLKPLSTILLIRCINLLNLLIMYNYCYSTFRVHLIHCVKISLLRALRAGVTFIFIF